MDDTFFKKSQVDDVSLLYVEDSGIELYKTSQTDSNLEKERKHSQVKSTVQLNKKKSVCTYKFCGAEKAAHCHTYLLYSYVFLKRKIETASEILQLGSKKLVQEARKDALHCLYANRENTTKGHEGKDEINDRENTCDGIQINAIPTIIITPPLDQEMIGKERCATIAPVTDNTETSAVSKILSQFRQVCEENRILRRNAAGYKALNEDCKIRYNNYRDTTEKTLAKLGEYVMNSRNLAEECKVLKDVVERTNLERKFSLERLQESQILVETLKLGLAEEEKRAKFFENQAQNLEDILEGKQRKLKYLV